MASPQSNYYAQDGYRYGVMFNDGSVKHSWNGDTQREQAIDCAAAILLEQMTYAGRTDNITPCRRRNGGEWERITPE